LKKIIVMVLLISLIAVLSGELSISRTSNGFLLNYENENLADSEQEITKVIALPSESVEITVRSCEVKTVTEDGQILGSRSISGSDKVELVEDFVMRELYGHIVRIKLNEETRGVKERISSISFDVDPVDPVEIPGSVSMVFQPVYEKMVDNYEQSYLRDGELSTPSMLIITPPQIVNTLQPFIEWKNERGIRTQVATLDETGSTALEIKNFIQNIFDTSETPPDYVLIFGDGDEGFFVVPSFYITATGETDVTDHPFSLLQGDDYFPELIVGRISIDTITELQRIITKVLYYEKTPYMGSNWFEDGLIVAGNYASTLPIPTTPVKVSKWLRDKMYDYGYNNITEVYYPPTNDGATEINNAINNGVGFVSYRGWGDANGWHKPEYHTEDMVNLNNGFQLPIVTSIVCNTGDFVNSVDPCFGEAMLRAHVGTTPKGAVAVVAPSDLHTSTKFNNAIFSGFYSGVLDEDIFSFGAAVLRGKYELHDNYPTEREPGEYVEFYFHVYNILGDPSIQMWTRTPQEITLGTDLPDQIGLGTNYLEVQCPSLDGAVVTAIKEDEFFEVSVVESGVVVLMIDPETTGDIKITITKPNYLPLIETIEVVQNNIDIGIEEHTLSNEPKAGSTLDLSITLKNYGSSNSEDVNAQLTTSNENIIINTTSVNYGVIAPGATVINDFSISIEAGCPEGEIVDLNFDFGVYGDAKIRFIVNSLLFEVNGVTIDGDGIADPGETVDIEVTLFNAGSFDVSGLQAEIVALSDAVSVEDQVIDLGSIAMNSEGSGSFTAEIFSDCLVGRTVSFRFDLTDSEAHETHCIVSIEIGEVSNTDPTFSERMDYFAYDSFDTGYDEAPTYNWYEIDPQEGGEGDVIFMHDDHSESYELPFQFKYYGVDYDSLTICSNGWISFETTWMTLFRNWNIPAPLGAYAMVAPFWDDMKGEPFTVNDTLYFHDMRICKYYDESDNVFIVEWNACFNRFDLETIEKFQVVLFDPLYYPTVDGNGEIQFNYHTIDNIDANNNYATVGIESPDQMHGILYTFADLYPPSATPLQDNMAIKFTTDPPDNYNSSDDPAVIPFKPELYANYPNPFNPETNISFSVPEASYVELEIFNMKGQLVKKLVQENVEAGLHNVIWKGNDELGNSVGSGIYYYRLDADGNIKTRKCILLK